MRIEAPIQIEHTFTQRLQAPPEAVFPLLCPVREREWVPGWDPEVVFTRSGVAEPDGVFITLDHGRRAVWYITRHDPESFQVEFIKTIPDFTVSRIRIALKADGVHRTLAEVRYRHTALSPAGQTFVRDFTRESYVKFMEGWEDELNVFLTRKPGR
ncbi:MAG: hypothetical protein OEW39_01530 [Deltaproteobacteria bacterium]|nr:hypothetical protein [Deltaproteobacteria bacterium]